jgi:hypothetical protein
VSRPIGRGLCEDHQKDVSEQMVCHDAENLDVTFSLINI